MTVRTLPSNAWGQSSQGAISQANSEQLRIILMTMADSLPQSLIRCPFARIARDVAGDQGVHSRQKQLKYMLLAYLAEQSFDKDSLLIESVCKYDCHLPCSKALYVDGTC